MKEERAVRIEGRLKEESRRKVHTFGIRRMDDGKEGPQEGPGATPERSAIHQRLQTNAQSQI